MSESAPVYRGAIKIEVDEGGTFRLMPTTGEQQPLPRASLTYVMINDELRLHDTKLEITGVQI